MEKITRDAVSPLHADELSRLLDEFRGNQHESTDRVFALVYGELRKLARQQLRHEKAGHTLVATALVHEAFVKLLGNPVNEWHGRGHFFSVAARAMRQILVEYARRRQAQKRGGQQHRTTLDDRYAAAAMDPEELLALDTALERLGELDDRLGKVVEYRFYCGLDDGEIAELLGISQRTVERDWVKARAWLYRELYRGSGAPEEERDAAGT